MEQKIIFPLKFWNQGSANGFECPMQHCHECRTFLDNLQGLEYTELWGTFILANGEILPCDSEGNETFKSWDMLVLKW